MSDLADGIVQDVLTNGRGFLPGRPCDESSLRANLAAPIMFDGLTDEESLLLLSALPRDAQGIFVSEMDKGLSGSRVLQGRYPTGPSGRLSKPFVLKVGPRVTIERETQAMQELVIPFVPGAVPPIYRCGPTMALLVQELAGLGSASELVSFRVYAREQADAAEIVERLFIERLHRWYHPTGGDRTGLAFGTMFERYLNKASAGPDPRLPEEWIELERWVHDISGFEREDDAALVLQVCSAAITVVPSVVHGDLHSQNVVIDATTRECWPIDFAWCHDGSSPLVDCVMLECSLKFHALPMRADLRSLLELDLQLLQEPAPALSIARVPYSKEICNVLSAVVALRRIAADLLDIDFEDYLRGLFLMTYAHANHSGLNRPLVLGSLQMLAGTLRRSHS